MALTDEARRSLFTSLVTALGEADAVSLMDELSSAGQGPVSKEHVDQRFDAVDQRLDAIDRRFGDLEQRLTGHIERRLADQRADTALLLAKHTRVTVVATVAMNAATIAAVVAVAG